MAVRAAPPRRMTEPLLGAMDCIALRIPVRHQGGAYLERKGGGCPSSEDRDANLALEGDVQRPK